MVDLNKIVGKLKSKFSTASVAENIEDPKDFVSTGNLSLDLMLDGGIPFGYVIEFLGLSQSGKSLLAQQIIANAMRDYKAVGILLDRERSFTKKRGIQLGIDPERLIIAPPDATPTVTDGFQFLIDSIKEIRSQDSDVYIVAVIDSISAFGKDTALEKSDSGRKAKATHEGLREIISVMDSKISLLMSNQVTYRVGVLYGDPKSSTMGESLKYYSNVRLFLDERVKIIDEKRGGEVIGTWLEVEVGKTRLGPCFRKCFIQHFYNTGINYYSGYARLLADRGYLTPKNKAEFNRFKQSTVIWSDGGEKEQYSEFDVEKVVEKHPELLFTSYPEYNISDKKPEEDTE